MSIDITLQTPRKERFSESLSGNTMEIAIAAKLYNPIWCPCQFLSDGATVCLTPKAGELIVALFQGLKHLRAHPESYRNESGLHDYLALRDFTEKYLSACNKWPDALVVVT